MLGPDRSSDFGVDRAGLLAVTRLDEGAHLYVGFFNASFLRRGVATLSNVDDWRLRTPRKSILCVT